MKAYWKYLIIGVAIVVSAWLLARAYTYKYHAQETIVVTGLGETEFSSDLIVWNGFITAEAQNVAAGYAEIEQSKQKVQKYLEDKGLDVIGAEFTYIPNNLKDVTPEQRETIDKMVEKLEEFADVQTVYTNMKPE